MPYILFAFGIALGVFGLYRFFVNAQPKQIVSLFLSAFFVIICGALIFLSITGRLPAALALLGSVWPLALVFWRTKQKPVHPRPAAASSSAMTRAEAFAVLGLKDDSTSDEIREAHRTLIAKIHPDQQGSDWLAARVNQARDILLGP